MPNQVQHLGVIMDGNRRWARKHMFTSVMKGHEKGVDTFIDLCKWCQEAGIRYLTVYAFSTENWNRSQEEVTSLFKLMGRFFVDEVQTCLDRDIRMVIIGDKTRLAPEDQETVRKTEEITAHCNSLICQVAISYGGRDEIVRAARKYAEDLLLAQKAGKAGGEAAQAGMPDGSTEAAQAGRPDGSREAVRGIPQPQDLTEEIFEKYLDTAGVPDIDLVIRTGGNRRLSNFFPWQTTYAEIWFTDTLWPDFSQKELKQALDYYEAIQINKGK